MTSINLHLEEEYNTIVANTGEGFYLFSLNQLEKQGPYCEIYKPYLVRMLSPTYCLFVTQKSSDSGILSVDDKLNSFSKSYTIMVLNTVENKIILHFTIGHKILNMIAVEKYILIVTVSQILVYSQDILTNNNDPNNVSFVKTIHTFTNPQGLCSAKCNKNTLVIATLGRSTGEIMICTLKKKSNLYITAHNNNITNIVLDDKCEMVSTTSESGTLINVFDIPNCAKVYQFRRGIFGTIIHDVKFDPTSNYLTCCSNNGTVHIFHLYDKSNNDTEHKNTTSNFSMLGGIMPVCYSEWAYKLFKINAGIKSKCYFIKRNNETNIHIVSDDSTYYVINNIEQNLDQIIKHDIGKLCVTK